MAAKPAKARFHHRFLAAAAGFAACAAWSVPAHALQRLALTVGPDIPHILTGEIALIYSPRWTIAASGGGFAYTFQSNGTPIPLSIAAGDLRIRYFPFQGSFFLGLTGGFQNLAASASGTFDVNVSGQTVPVPASASVAVFTPYITPHLGWFVVTRWKFVFGFEGGVQFATSANSTVNLGTSDPSLSQYLSLVQATSSYQQIQSTVQDDINKYATHWLPYLSIRLGWAF